VPPRSKTGGAHRRRAGARGACVESRFTNNNCRDEWSDLLRDSSRHPMLTMKGGDDGEQDEDDRAASPRGGMCCSAQHVEAIEKRVVHGLVSVFEALS